MHQWSSCESIQYLPMGDCHYHGTGNKDFENVGKDKIRITVEYNPDTFLTIFLVVLLQKQTSSAEKTTYVGPSGGKCILMEKSDRAACRTNNFNRCVTPEEAQTICTGKWRLPYASEWSRIITSTNDDTDSNQLCIQEKDNCDSGHSLFPNRYVIQETYPDDGRVGSFVEFSLIIDEFIDLVQHFKGSVRDSDVEDAYSVRCMRTVIP